MKEIVGLCGAGPVVLAGDMNARGEDVDDWIAAHRLCDAEYKGRSWAPKECQYYDNWKTQPWGDACDRILFRGDVWVVSWLVGQTKIYSCGEAFCFVGPQSCFRYFGCGREFCC